MFRDMVARCGYDKAGYGRTMNELAPWPAVREQHLRFLVGHVESLRPLWEIDRSRACWLLKEAVFAAWEWPQLRRHPLRLGKYSFELPWSPKAADRLRAWSPGEKAAQLSGSAKAMETAGIEPASAAVRLAPSSIGWPRSRVRRLPRADSFGRPELAARRLRGNADVPHG